MRRLSTRDGGFEQEFLALLHAPRMAAVDVAAVVADIIADVRARGDEALCDLTARLDQHAVQPEAISIDPDELDAAAAHVPAELMTALDLAASRIEAFHRAQRPVDLEVDDPGGLRLGMRWTPLDAVGVYVPGGKAAYPSSVLMNAIPARVAGVARIAMCVPCPGGALNPLVLAAARRAGVSQVFRIGGAQAVAAMAYGTATIAPVDRIVGPGNAYVAEAKRQVFGHVGIDSIAGPSEVVVIADGGQDARMVAVDLLAQAEHDEAAQSILITDDAAFIDRVTAAIEAELRTLPRAAIAGASWRDHGAVILVRDWSEAAAVSDRIAPEHLQIMLPNPGPVFDRVRHAGAVFLGPWCPEALGDYMAGPNHVLPTSRTARYSSGLSTYDFLKRTTWVAGDRPALEAGGIGHAAALLADAEGLDAHARSLRLRLGTASA